MDCARLKRRKQVFDRGSFPSKIEDDACEHYSLLLSCEEGCFRGAISDITAALQATVSLTKMP